MSKIPKIQMSFEVGMLDKANKDLKSDRSKIDRQSSRNESTIISSTEKTYLMRF